MIDWTRVLSKFENLTSEPQQWAVKFGSKATISKLDKCPWCNSEMEIGLYLNYIAKCKENENHIVNFIEKIK